MRMGNCAPASPSPKTLFSSFVLRLFIGTSTFLGDLTQLLNSLVLNPRLRSREEERLPAPELMLERQERAVKSGVSEPLAPNPDFRPCKFRRTEWV